MKFPTMDEFAQNVAEKALEYKGKTLRQWIEIISASEHGTNLAEVGADCISRQQAIDALRKLREEDIEDYGCEIPEGFNQDHLDRATFAIKQLPPIQPEPKRGKWIHHPEIGWGETWLCDQCGENCGADMRGEQDG